MGIHVVTGAASGIGQEVARSLIARGERVILPVRSAERLEEVAARLPGYESISVVDLADAEAVAQWAADLLVEGPEALDSLVHCAGVVELGAVADLDLAAWQRQLAVNLVAPAVLTSALLPPLRTARGTVVLVNSTAGLVANAAWSAYAASKAGLRSLADALREEERAHGVRVTSVFPSRTATPMQERVHAQEGRAYDAAAWIRPETVAAQILAVLDLPGDATVPEVVIRPR